MWFVAQSPVAGVDDGPFYDPDVTQTLAEALRDLSDPDALSGLDADDRARIRNFAVPPP